MEQPELGIYIAQLRKEQGLTQEELVEKCNINVRTIQRIEAGEVKPRSYTVKNILEALGSSFDEVYSGNSKTKTEASTTVESLIFNKSKLMLAGIAGIVLFICYYIMTINDVAHSFTEENLVSQTLYVGLGIGSVIAVILFYIGIYHIASVKSNSLLKFASIFSMIVFIISSVLLIAVIDYNTSFKSTLEIILGMFVLVSSGISYIMLGAGYMSQRRQEEGMARYLGFIGLIAGGMMITVLLAPLAIAMIMIFDIGQILYVFKAMNTKNPQLKS